MKTPTAMKSLSMAAITVLLMIVGTLGSCGKYDDGPNFSLRTKKSRLKGTWVIQEQSDFTKTYTFAKNGDATVTKEYYSGAGGISYTDYESKTWEFTNNKQFLSIYDSDGDTYRTYKITRLTKKELWVDGSENSHESLTWVKTKE